MRTKFKKWAVCYLDESKNVLKLDDFNSILEYLNKKNIYLEIGPGKGQFILGLAKDNPNNNYLLIEINKTIAGICIKNIDDNEINNIKLIPDDFFKLANSLPNNIIEGIYLNFSDPWPKSRHAKRRLTHPNFLKEYYRILKKDGLIYFKTDNYDFYLYSKESFLNEKFKVIKDETNYNLSSDDYLTEFEEKYIKENKSIFRLILKKE